MVELASVVEIYDVSLPCSVRMFRVRRALLLQRATQQIGPYYIGAERSYSETVRKLNNNFSTPVRRMVEIVSAMEVVGWRHRQENDVVL